MAQIYYSDLQHFSEAIQQAAVLLLSPMELQRYQQFKRPQTAATYLLGRYLCRLVMARLCDCKPEQFSMAASGPTQFIENIAPWHINLSHSGGLVCCVVSDDGACGVDVEYLLKPRPFVRLVEHFYADSEGHILEGVPAAGLAQIFYQSWTLKEAFIKARAKTIANHLNDLLLEISDGKLRLQVGQPMVQPWSFYQLQLNGYVIAWAVQNTQKQQLWQLNLLNQTFEANTAEVQQVC